jgi:genome maintenance exonuclease 1
MVDKVSQAELRLDRFPYVDKQTIQVLGRRFYEVTPELAYPSITSVLGHTLPEADKNWLTAWKNRVGEAEAAKRSKRACDRGTNMHLMLERYMRHEDPKIDEFPPEHAKLFKSLRAALNKVNTVYGQEVALYSHSFQVAGRCDMVADYEGELSIIDYKSSTYAKTKDDINDYWVQTAFYALAHNELFGTNITKLVILMGVEGKLPLVFKHRVTDDLIVELATRTAEFYDELEKQALKEQR